MKAPLIQKMLHVSWGTKWRVLPPPQNATALIPTFCGRDVVPLCPAARNGMGSGHGNYLELLDKKFKNTPIRGLYRPF